MFISKETLALWCLSVGSAAAFSTPAASTTRVAFVGRTAAATGFTAANSQHATGCSCPACASTHAAGCLCPSCRGTTALFADAAPEDSEAVDEDVPSEVLAMDGVESADEAHNVERPARQQLKKKKPTGVDITELEVGSTVPGTVKSLASYGAFVDIGATTDGLLHISQLSTEFVGDVSDVVKEGQEVQVRIVNVDTTKGQVGLSMITAEEAAASQAAAAEAREARQAARDRRQNNNRRDDSGVLGALKSKGWDTSAMVEGTVVSTVDFGCFVRVDASKLNSECEGEFDGLVHISALRSGRVGSVTDVVSVDDKVQVRVKSIDGTKVSLTMLTEDDENAKAEAAASSGGPVEIEGAKDWKEILVKFDENMPSFQNLAVIEDRRK